MAPGASSAAAPPPVQRHDSEEDNTRRPGSGGGADFPELPGVPDDVPSGAPGQGSDEFGKRGEDEEEIDFDDLTKRFEALKKKK